MPLTWKTETLYMEWCLDCHRNPEAYIRPKENVFDLGWVPEGEQIRLGQTLVEHYAIAPPNELDDCTICHR